MVGDPLLACRESRRGPASRVIGQTNRRYKREEDEEAAEESVASKIFSFFL